MAVFKCKMCGANLEISENQSVVTCTYCMTQQTLPKVDNEKKLALFNRANNLRFKSEFDKAAGIYESIIAEFSDEAEAYWGLVLCKYGIEYVDDKDGRKIPTCHRTLPTSIIKDADFQQACEYADITAKNIYRAEAKAIDAIQKKILEIASTEAPYDIFICYKETDDVTGARTEDSSIAQDIYTALTEMGYKVFYARNSLRRVAGAEYEPYIYAALSSAKVMLAIGTKYEYYDAVWVKNEWSRFISMMADNRSKVLIPCYKNMDAYDIPEEFSNMQALDMSDMMFFNSLEASVKRISPKKNKPKTANETVVNSSTGAPITSLLKRAFMFLEDGDFDRADDFCEQVLNIDPENAEAYLGKLLIELRVKTGKDLKNCSSPFDNRQNYKKIMRYGDEDLKVNLKKCIEIINTRVENERIENIYNSAKSIMDSAKTEDGYKDAAIEFRSIKNYKDSSALYEKCIEKIEQKKREAENAKKQAEIERKENKKIAIKVLFVSIILVVVVFVLVMFVIPYSKYQKELKLLNEGKYVESFEEFDKTFYLYDNNKLYYLFDKDGYVDKLLDVAIDKKDYKVVCNVYLDYKSFCSSQHFIPESDSQEFYEYVSSTYSFVDADVYCTADLVGDQVALFELLPSNSIEDILILEEFHKIVKEHGQFDSLVEFMQNNLDRLINCWNCKQVQDWLLSDNIITEFMLGEWYNEDYKQAKYLKFSKKISIEFIMSIVDSVCLM